MTGKDLTLAEEAADAPLEQDVLDAGPTSGGGPVRRCIATGERRSPGEMVRFVVSPDGEAVPDIAGRLPGRGAWVSSDREAMNRAAERRLFSRAFRQPVSAPDDLADRVEALLARRALDRLGLAKRAAEAVHGFDRVTEEIRKSVPGVLIEASDGAEDGRSKVLGLLHGVHGGSGSLPIVAGCFSMDELGMALGRPRVVHACIKRGRIAEAWIEDVTRLAGFRPIRPPDWRSGTDR